MRPIHPGPLLVGMLVCATLSDAATVRVSSDSVPAILEAADLPDGITALAISPDGQLAAYAKPAVREGFSDLVWLDSAAADRPGRATLPGAVRDLLFLSDGRGVVGLQFRAAKKRQGDTFLFAWDGSAKPRRVMRVPPSSNDLDRWPGGDAILLACRNEIRTLLPPDFRSGPLFSLPGDNFALSSLAHSSYVVVGREDGLSLLDLSVPSGRESMPVLLSLALPARVGSLADYPDGDEVLARLDDGRLFRVSFDPPDWNAAGTADLIAGITKSARVPSLPFAPPARAEGLPPADSRAEPAGPEATPQTRSAPEEAVAGEPALAAPRPKPERSENAEAPDAGPAAGQTPEAETEPPPPAHAETHAVEPEPSTTERTLAPPAAVAAGLPEREAAAPAEPAATQPEPAPPAVAVHQAEGRIVGRVGLVQSVVLLGPDNILREAARVRPGDDGSWFVDGLDPGRYRVQLDAGGERILVAEPRFLMIEVGETPTQAPEIKAVRAF